MANNRCIYFSGEKKDVPSQVVLKKTGIYEILSYCR